jgi:hypothetical protein
MTNDANRMLIVIVAAAMIVLAALLIFVTWSADTDAIDRLGDFVEFLDDNNDSAGKLIITLGGLIIVVLALLMIVVELAPEDEQKELRVKQGDATTIVPATALRARIEEALIALPEVTAARARVNTRDKGIATALDLTLIPGANISLVTKESARVVTDTIQADLGLPVAGVPSVRVSFGSTGAAPVSSSIAQPPTPEPMDSSESSATQTASSPTFESPAPAASDAPAPVLADPPAWARPGETAPDPGDPPSNSDDASTNPLDPPPDAPPPP